MVTTSWNLQVQIYRTIPINKPNFIIRGNENGAFVLIDISVLEDRKKPK
jgi:hypothetical protein